MEQQEAEKKIKVYQRQRRRRRSKSSSSFPLDLALEILLRLPERSVVRFRSVSKPWSSISTDPYFINLYKARCPRLLLCFQANEKLFVSSIPQHHQTFETSNKSSYSSSQPIELYHMEFPTYIIFRPTESVQGLICFEESAKPVVWNPNTRQLLTLPKPRKSWNDLRILLGYDPVECKHKVMCIPFSGSSDECMVLTLGSAQELWRTVKTNLNICSSYRTSSGRCINGVVYYLVNVYPSDDRVLVSFDVRSEKFDKIQLPPSDVHNDVLTYHGRLACVDRKPNIKNGIRLWILEDAEKQHKWWSSKDFLAPFDPHGRVGRSLVPKGFTDSGEFIYVEHMFSKPSCILFCDPVRNSFRRFELKGITDDESMLNNLYWYRLHVLPNHVESRVSL